MLILEIIGEMLSPLFEFIFYSASYFTGYFFLSIVSFGKVKMSPYLSAEERSDRRGRWYHFDFGIYEEDRKHGKYLRSEAVCLVGFLVWVALGLCIYLVVSNDGANGSAKKEVYEKIEFTDPRLFTENENSTFKISIEGKVNKPHVFELAKQYRDSPLITLDHMIDRAGGVGAFGHYVYVVRETREHFEISKFKVISVKSGDHEDFKLFDGDLIYVGPRESALNTKRDIEMLSDSIQKRIRTSGKTCRWWYLN